MKKRFDSTAALLALTAAILVAAPLAVTPSIAQTTSPRRTVPPERLRPLRDILQQVLPIFPGQVLKSEQTREANGQPVYRLHILDDAGDILVVTVDARTARIISARDTNLHSQ
jgi:uncharacterized membrane protein YkoI